VAYVLVCSQSVGTPTFT